MPRKKNPTILFIPHPEIEGKHAILSPSKHAWLGDDMEKFITRLDNELAKQRGTELHELAKTCIKNRIKLKEDGTTLSLYVNDAIDLSMKPEVPVKYSDYAFGTIDAVSWREDIRLLRIHDLKTGMSPASEWQLIIYAAYVCLENAIDPTTINFELRIYQNNDYKQWNPTGEEMKQVCNLIVQKDTWTKQKFNKE